MNEITITYYKYFVILTKEGVSLLSMVPPIGIWLQVPN